jgi:hypothetical protein
MNGECSMHGKYEICVLFFFFLENLNESGHSEEQHMDGKIILERILAK